jgi:glycosyltransferase involved in cell wall biosynthesis
MQKRIVFHTASLRGGGAERVFVLMANALAARGHDVTLFTWNAEGPNAALVSDAVRLVDLGMPIRGEGYGKGATLHGLLKSAWFFRKTKPDVVFSAPEFANLVMTLALTLAFSRAGFFPSFHAAAALGQSAHGARLAIGLSKLVAGRAEKAIAVSSGVGRDLVGRGFPATKITVIHNPLPPASATPPQTYPWQQSVIDMGDGPVIVTAGRLTPVKDHRTLLRAFALLRTRRPARLVIFGEGPLEDELHRYSSELGIGGDVLFPGYVNDPHACYAVADVFVLSSTSEGFGNVLVEAMAAGVPVVSTDAPHGPREILMDGQFGPLVPVGDAEALAAAISAMLHHPTSEALLKARASDFDLDRIADAYENLIDPARVRPLPN